MPDKPQEEMDWCMFASRRTLGVRESESKGRLPDSLRYVIIGNHKDGLMGIERDLKASCGWNEYNQFWWAFNVMEPQRCKRILKDRL
jgi:hypothetical protein